MAINFLKGVILRPENETALQDIARPNIPQGLDTTFTYETDFKKVKVMTGSKTTQINPIVACQDVL